MCVSLHVIPGDGEPQGGLPDTPSPRALVSRVGFHTVGESSSQLGGQQGQSREASHSPVGCFRVNPWPPLAIQGPVSWEGQVHRARRPPPAASWESCRTRRKAFWLPGPPGLILFVLYISSNLLCDHDRYACSVILAVRCCVVKAVYLLIWEMTHCRLLTLTRLVSQESPSQAKWDPLCGEPQNFCLGQERVTGTEFTFLP